MLKQSSRIHTKKRTRVLNRSRTRFYDVLELSESQQLLFYLSKTMIFEDSHVHSQIALELQNNSNLGPPSVKHRVENRKTTKTTTSPEPCLKNTCFLDSEITPKQIQHRSKIAPNI